MTEDINKIVSEYLESYKENSPDDVDLSQLKKKREEWESKANQLDEDDPLNEIAQSNIEDYKEKIERIEESEKILKQRETELLQTASNKFIPRGEWTTEEVLRALNISLLEIDRSYILVGNTRIEAGTTITDDEETFKIATTIREVIDEELGESDALRQFWEDFQELKRFEYFIEIATSEEPLTGKDIAERRGEKEKRQSISQSLIDTTEGEVNPYSKRGRGEYTLSLTGEYILENYSEIREDSGSKGENNECSKGEESDSEATLDKFE